MRHFFSFDVSAVAGLHSILTSALRETLKFSYTQSSSVVSCSVGRTVGVPPPI